MGAMKCSDCASYKTKECWANPAGNDWDNAESYSCFTLKGRHPAELQMLYASKKAKKR